MRKALWALLIAVGLAVPISAYATTTILRQPAATPGGWTNLLPAGSPGDGIYASIAYDSRADQVIYFPGNDTWAYNVTTNAWVGLHPSVVPPVTERSAMVYDPRADRVILFGGYDPAAGLSNETWAYDYRGNTWTRLSPAISPPARAAQALAYDERDDRVVMFGGMQPGVCCAGQSNETWVYDYANDTWRQMSPELSPPARNSAPMAYDSQRGLFVLFGGQIADGDRFANDTWTYDLGADAWTNVTRGASPPRLYAPGMVYDASADRIVLFGGSFDDGTTAGYTNETWTYDPGAESWIRMATQASPLARYWPGLVYDSAAKAVILVGGFWYGPNPSPPTTVDTWRFDYPSTA